MARVDVPVTQLTRGGVADAAPVTGDPVNGHSVLNDGRVWVEVSNADGAAAHNVTFVTPGTVDAQAIADRTVSIPLSESRRFGPWPPSIYGGSLLVDVDDAQLSLTAYRI